MTVIELTPLDLVMAAVPVLALTALTVRMRLGLGKTMLIAMLRLTLQLLLVGMVLGVLFSHVRLYWVILMALFMVAVAGREVMARQQRRLAGWWGYGMGTLSLFVSSFSITVLALIFFIGPLPWYTPQYAIPLLGMLLGNTMTGVALAMDRLNQTAWQQRAVIEERLLLGQTYHQAIADIRRDSLRAGLTPIINAMAAAGLVSLPGMMTGQILAGSPPFEAVKYQILIMFLIAAGTGFGTMIGIRLTSGRLFDHRHRLRLDRLKTKQK